MHGEVNGDLRLVFSNGRGSSKRRSYANTYRNIRRDGPRIQDFSSAARGCTNGKMRNGVGSYSTCAESDRCSGRNAVVGNCPSARCASHRDTSIAGVRRLACGLVSSLARVCRVKADVETGKRRRRCVNSNVCYSCGVED